MFMVLAELVQQDSLLGLKGAPFLRSPDGNISRLQDSCSAIYVRSEAVACLVSFSSFFLAPRGSAVVT